MKNLCEYPIQTQSKITGHKMYTRSDFEYLSNRGHTPKEILKIWDNELELAK